MQPILFYLFSTVSIVSALSVVLLKKPTRALLSLVVTMASLSVLYVLLEAPLIALINLIVYAGAVLVLFLFVIMLLGIGATDEPITKRFSMTHLFCVAVVVLAFFGMIVYGLQKGTQYCVPSTGDTVLCPPGLSTEMTPGEADTIGLEIFTGWLLPFELTSLLLLLGIFAATSLAKKDDSPERFLSKDAE